MRVRSDQSSYQLQWLSPLHHDQQRLRTHNVYISLRKSSEWGITALQGTFTRMKSILSSIEKKRSAVIILLHNFRTEVVFLNQSIGFLMWNMTHLLASETMTELPSIVKML